MSKTKKFYSGITEQPRTYSAMTEVDPQAQSKPKVRKTKMENGGTFYSGITTVKPKSTPAKPAAATAKPVSASQAKPATTPSAKPATPAVAKPAQTPAVPYETDEQIEARYTQQLNDYDAQKRAEAERLRQQYNSQFNNAQRDNYIQYMQGHRELGEQLARQGITGGMSETANLRDRLNYENRYAGMEGQRQSALQGVDDSYADALYNYKTQADANLNTELAENRQLRSEYEQNLQERNEQRFVNTIGAYDTQAKINAAKKAALANGEAWKIPYLDQQSSALKQQGEASKQAEAERREQRFVNNIGGYDTVEKCDKAIKAARKNGESWKIPYLRQQKASLKQQGKAEQQARNERYEQRYANTISGWNSIDGINKEIKKIRKSGKNTWKIAYLRARRTELINAGQTGSGSGSSSSGGKSSGKSSGGGGGGGDSQTTTQQTTQEVKVPKLGGEKKKGSSISVKDVKNFKSTGKGSAAGKAKGRTSGGHRVSVNKPGKTKVPARAMWR